MRYLGLISSIVHFSLLIHLQKYNFPHILTTVYHVPKVLNHSFFNQTSNRLNPLPDLKEKKNCSRPISAKAYGRCNSIFIVWLDVDLNK